MKTSRRIQIVLALAVIASPGLTTHTQPRLYGQHCRVDVLRDTACGGQALWTILVRPCSSVRHRWQISEIQPDEGTRIG